MNRNTKNVQKPVTRLLKTLGLAGATIFVVGCASTAPTQSANGPTHYWDSDATAEVYNKDNVTCQRETDSASQEAFETDSLSFQAYRDCMVSKGYTLRTY